MTATGSDPQIEASVLNYPDFLLVDLDPYIYSGKEKKGGQQISERTTEHREGGVE